MLPSRAAGISRLHFLLQQAGVLALVWGIYPAVNFALYGNRLPARDYVDASLILLGAALLERLTRDSRYAQFSGLSPRERAAISHRQTLFSLVSIFGAMVMLKDDSLSRIFLAVFFLAYFGWISWTNRFGYRLLHRALYRTAAKGLAPTVLVGPAPAVRRFCADSRSIQPPGTEILGVVAAGGDGTAALAPDFPFPLLGQLGDLRAVCEETRAKALLFLGLGDRKDLVPPLTRMSRELGLRAMWMDDIRPWHGASSQGWHHSGYDVISPLREPLEDPLNRALKRGVDLAGSAVGIALLLPPALLLAAVLHRLYSPGPLFYRQERSGRNGEPFQMLKFRSMAVQPEGAFVQASRGDARIFRGGGFLRRSSIDELPQLLNVFMGQMSLVGPRPHPVALDEELAATTARYRLRQLAKPGITGLAQCRGWRGETRSPEQARNRVRLDLFYIQRWSLWLDFRVIAETAGQVMLPPKSAF